MAFQSFRAGGFSKVGTIRKGPDAIKLEICSRQGGDLDLVLSNREAAKLRNQLDAALADVLPAESRRPKKGGA